METDFKKIHELLEKFNTAMLITHGRDGVDHARPMGIVKVDPNCDLWFFTGLDSEKNREIEHNQKVLIACQKDHSCYLSLAGHARISTDRSKIAELWKESYKVWFPEGINDPNLALIYVNLREAEFWDSTGLKSVKYLFETAKAYVTGQTPKIDPDQHGHVVLK